MNRPQDFKEVIPTNAVVTADPLMFGGFDRGWDLESAQAHGAPLVENGYTVDMGGVILKQAVPPEAYRSQTRPLHQVAQMFQPREHTKYDIFDDPKNHFAHVYRTQFDDKDWNLNAVDPEDAESIVHIGVFKNTKCAKNYLQQRFNLTV